MGRSSALLGIHLQPHEKLLMSGDDLSNFFYTFAVNYDRCTRNYLDWKIPTHWVQSMSGFPEELLGESHVYACLSSLAMGDSAACGCAQTSHISMGLQCGAFKQCELVTMHGRLPRSPSMAGIIIGDLILMEKVHRSATGSLSMFRNVANDKLCAVCTVQCT